MNSIQRFLILLFFIPTVLFGQGKDSNNTKQPIEVCLNFGGGFPLPFSIDYIYKGGAYSGSANTGYFVNLAADFPINKTDIGLTGMIGYGLNPENTEGFTGINTPYINQLMAMSGITLMPLSHGRIQFGMHFLAGVLYYKTDGMAIKGTYIGRMHYYFDFKEVINSVETIASIYDIGMFIKGNVKKGFYGSISIDILHSALNGGLSPTIQYTPANPGDQGFSIRFSEMSLFNLTAGLGYRF